MKKTLSFVLLSLFIFATQVSARDYLFNLTAFDFSVKHIAESDFEDSDVGIKQTEFELQFIMPMKISSKDFVTVSPQIRANKIEFTGTQGTGIDDDDFPEVLFSGELNMAYVHKFEKEWSSIVKVSPGIKSDLEDIDEKDFSFSATVMGQKNFAKGSAGLGLAYSDNFGSPEFFPVLGFLWNFNDSWKLYGTLPVNIYLEKKFSESFNAGLSGEITGGQYRLSEDSPWNEAVLNHTKVLIGPYADFKAGQKSRIKIAAGIVTAQEMEFRDKDDTDKILSEADIEDSVYINLNIYYPF